MGCNNWTVEERAVLAWVRGHLGNTRHERRVARVASRLFDVTSRLHRLTGEHRRLLRLAALVHDVGRGLDDDDHPSEGAFLLLANRSLPLSTRDRRVLAFLTLHHRGTLPDARRPAILKAEDGFDDVNVLLALLRAADAVDSRRRGPARVRFELDRSRLKVHAFVARKRDAIRERKLRLLGSAIGCDVALRVRAA